jgi:hypothetical protein
MTSFTHYSGASFTLLRERSERGSAIKDGMEKCGHSGATGAFCHGGESAREAIPGSHTNMPMPSMMGTGTGSPHGAAGALPPGHPNVPQDKKSQPLAKRQP